MKYTYTYIYGQTLKAYDKLIEVLWSIEDESQLEAISKMTYNFDKLCDFYKSKLYDNLFYSSPWMTSVSKKELEKYNNLVDEMVRGFENETDLKLNEMKIFKDIDTIPPSKVKIKGFKYYEE